ncbi:outer membrane beta-barrel protein [Sulfurimonas sp.]|uniref:outer membrane beta-barrel protein n=1 Tax=Sulfurimonas sp. TaxID=2022749 RepID=UPI003566B5F2
MKKILLFSLLITSLYSDAKVYMGVGAGYMNETFSDTASTTNTAEMGKLKIGYGVREAYAIEFSFDYLKNDANVFSTTGKDSDKFGMNVELVKAFDWDIFINPYFKAGFGAGYFDINHAEASSLNYGSFNLGLGFFVPVNEHLDIEVGYDYKYVSYEKLTDSNGNILVDVDSHLNGAYVGLNVRF